MHALLTTFESEAGKKEEAIEMPELSHLYAYGTVKTVQKSTHANGVTISPRLGVCER